MTQLFSLREKIGLLKDWMNFWNEGIIVVSGYLFCSFKLGPLQMLDETDFKIAIRAFKTIPGCLV